MPKVRKVDWKVEVEDATPDPPDFPDSDDYDPRWRDHEVYIDYLIASGRPVPDDVDDDL